MKNRTACMSFVVLALFLTLAPAALASNTWYVDGVNGSDSNDCLSSTTACKTIGHAISLCSSGDTIMVAPATYTENLTINISLRIIGSGATTTIVDGGGVGTVFTSAEAVDILLSGLTIRNGYNQYYGGGIGIGLGTMTINQSIITANSAFWGGGGISNGGRLTINRSTISGNSLAYEFAGGGGIYNTGALTVNRSTITANSAGFGGSGGGVLSGCCAYTTLTINNSTVSGNSASDGGGIYITDHRATINNSTLSGNSATGDGGGIVNCGTMTINNGTIAGNSAGGGSGGIQQNIWPNWGSLTLQNSIIANNTANNIEGNCAGTMTSNGYNLSSDNTCTFYGPGDMNNTNPKLGTLGNYGGPTQTIPLLEGSRAIDAGNPNGCTDGNGNLLTTDQRGKPRPDPEDTGGCDIGAYERQQD